MKGRTSVHFQFILALIVITLSSNLSSEALSDDLTITIGRQVHSEVEVNLEILNSLPASNFSPGSIGRNKQTKELTRALEPKTIHPKTDKKFRTAGAKAITPPAKPKIKVSKTPKFISPKKSSSISTPIKPNLEIKKSHDNKKAQTDNNVKVATKSANRDDKIKKRRAISRPASSKGQRELAILFESETLTLALGENEKLNRITSQLIDKPNQGIQLISYASTRSKNASAARRLSLQRALKIRNKLIKNGVPATKMSVRALGDRVKSGSPDRVDIIMTK